MSEFSQNNCFLEVDINSFRSISYFMALNLEIHKIQPYEIESEKYLFLLISIIISKLKAPPKKVNVQYQKFEKIEIFALHSLSANFNKS